MKTPPANKVLTINNQKFQLPNIDQQKYGIITINVNIDTEGKAIVTIKALGAEGKQVYDMKSAPNSSGLIELNSVKANDWSDDQKLEKSDKYKSIQDYLRHIPEDGKGYSRYLPRTSETQPVTVAVQDDDENADKVPVSEPGVGLDVSEQ